MQNLIYLDLGKNKVKNITIFTQEDNFQKLKYLDLQNNKLSEFCNFVLPSLEYLDVSYNKLEKVNETWNGHPNIKILKSIENKFKTLAPFKNMPKLQELYVSNNNITTLVGIDGVPALRKLHLRHNKIEKVEEEGLPDLPALEYLNLRTNKVSSMEDLARLFQYTSLKDINILNCPLELEYSSMNMLIGDVLAKYPTLKRFCKVDITDKHKLEAVYLAQYKWNKVEDERKRLEEEEKKKQELAEEQEG